MIFFDFKLLLKNIVDVEELYDLFQDIHVLSLQPSLKNNIVDVEELYDLFQDIYVLLRLLNHLLVMCFKFF